MTSKCIKCLTCGKGPKCHAWILRKIRYSTWSLRTQMLTGVCCSVACVLATTCFFISLFSFYLLQSTEESFLFRLDQAQEELIVSRSIMAAEQVESFELSNARVVLETAHILEELNKDSILGSEEYPISFENAEPILWEDLSDDQITETNGIMTSFDTMTYGWSTNFKSE